MPRTARERRWWFLAPLVFAAVLIVIDHTNDADHALTRIIFDAQTRTFPLRTSFWLDVVMHHWMKGVVITLGALLAVALALSAVFPVLKAQRRILLFLVLAMSLAPLSVALAESVSV